MTGLAPTIGRHRELARLRAEFAGADPPVIRVLAGMGGVGKTSVARAYVDEHRGDYGVVWWIRAEDPAAVDAEFRSLLEVLLPPGDAAQISDARTAALSLLVQQTDPWLLVLDNVADPAAAHELVPLAGRGHILITSQATNWPDPAIVRPVRPLDTESSVELLTSLSLDGDRASAEQLAGELDGLPLALTQAAGFVRSNTSDLATYLRLYRDRSAELLTEGQPANYPLTVATTWQLAIDRLALPARNLLHLLAFYAPDAIPVHLLFGWWDELARHRAIGQLHAYSLITPAESNTVNLHRLVQAVTRNRLRADLVAHEWADDARKVLDAVIPREPATAVRLDTWNALRTHVRALLDHLPPDHVDTLSLRRRLADWTGTAGDVGQARDLIAELLPVRERVLGSEHPNTLITRHQLAHWTGQAGDSAAAAALCAELLPVEQRVLGAEHPNTLTTQHNLAHWIGDTGDAKEARLRYAQLLPLLERVLGAEHPDTLVTRYTFAYWTGRAGRPEEARDRLADTLPVLGRVLGAEHPDTLATRHQLAYWTGRAGNPQQARELLAELAPSIERVLGAEHPDTLVTRYYLAYWTGEAGDAARASELFAELLPVRESVLGPGHPDTLATRQQLIRWQKHGTEPDGRSVAPAGWASRPR